MQKARGVQQGIIKEVRVDTALCPLARLTINGDLVDVSGREGRTEGQKGGEGRGRTT